MMTLKWWWVSSFLFSFLLALIIRLPYFGQVPLGLNRDEAGLAYNAYSLLKTGTDEYGKVWPVSVTSFGDVKLPGYIYILIPFIANLGLNTWVIRLPSLLAGVAIVLESGVLAQQVGRRLNWSEKKNLLLSTLAMIFIAVSPWANHFSRAAYEANLALALFLLGMISYYTVIDWSKPSRFVWQARALWLLTAVTWSATLLTYHAYQLFVPLIVVGLIVIDRKHIWLSDRVGLILGSTVGALTIAILLAGGVIRANEVKSRGITPFSTATVNQQFVSFRGLMPQNNAIYTKLMFNAPAELTTIFAQNYLNVFSGYFFFVHGSGHGDHDPGNESNLHLYMAPLLLIGILYLWPRRRVMTTQRLFVWLLIAIVPAALTIQPQHEVRLSPIFPVMNLIASIGAVALFFYLKKSWQQILMASILALCVFLSTTRMLTQYLFIFPNQVQANEGRHLLGQALIKYQKLGYPIITNNQSSSPYIWYLFESKYDPATYQTHVERYQPDDEGFIHVKRIDQIYFQTIKWEELADWAHQEPIVLILAPKDFPDDKKKNTRIKHLEDIKTSNGQIAYQVWEWDNNDPLIPPKK